MLDLISGERTFMHSIPWALRTVVVILAPSIPPRHRLPGLDCPFAGPDSKGFLHQPRSCLASVAFWVARTKKPERSPGPRRGWQVIRYSLDQPACGLQPLGMRRSSSQSHERMLVLRRS